MFIKSWNSTPCVDPDRESRRQPKRWQSGEPLEKANKVLQEITGQTPVKKKAKKPFETSVFEKANQSQS